MDLKPNTAIDSPDEPVPATAPCLDYQYAYLEKALIEQHAISNMPAVFLQQPADWIPGVVQTWWELLVESGCVRHELSRTNFTRTQPSVEATDVWDLFEYLKGNWIFIQPKLISQVRPLSDTEQQAMGAMDAALDYYEPQCWPNSRYLVDPDDERFATGGRCGIQSETLRPESQGFLEAHP